MRTLILIIFALAACGCREVKLAGTSYITEADFAGTKYRFTSDSTFEMRGWSCMSNDTGRGHYRLTRDSLIFYFDSLGPAQERVVIVDSSASAGDSCVLRITCRDDESTLPFVFIKTHTAAGLNRSTITDMDGMSTLKVARNEFPVTLEFRYVGYVGVKITFRSPADYTLGVKMRTSMMLVMSAGEVQAYKLKKLTRKEMKLEFEYVDAEEEKRTARWKLVRIVEHSKP